LKSKFSKLYKLEDGKAPMDFINNILDGGGEHVKLEGGKIKFHGEKDEL
jgi:hypothetical protein